MFGTVCWGLLIPFFGTVLGAAVVLLMRREPGECLSRFLAGFAAGIMVAASVWSLLIPAMEQAEHMGRWSFVPAVAGVWCGVFFLRLLDGVISLVHTGERKADGRRKTSKKNEDDGTGCHIAQYS